MIIPDEHKHEVYNMKRSICESMSDIYQNHCGVKTTWSAIMIVFDSLDQMACDYVLSDKSPIE